MAQNQQFWEQIGVYGKTTRVREIWAMMVTVLKLGNPRQPNVGWVRRLYVIPINNVSAVYDRLRYPERGSATPWALTNGDIILKDTPEMALIDFPKRACVFEQKTIITDQGPVYELSVSTEMTTHAPDFWAWMAARIEQEMLLLIEDQNGNSYAMGNEERGLLFGFGQQVAEMNNTKVSFSRRLTAPMLYVDDLTPEVLFAEIGFLGTDYTTDYIT